MTNDKQDGDPPADQPADQPGGDPAGTPAPQAAAPEENARVREWSQPWMAAAIEAMRIVPTVSEAARRSGVDRRTLQRAVQRDEEFAVALAGARDDALDQIESVLLLRARSGQPTRKTVTKTMADGSVETVVTEDSHLSDVAAFFLLKRWRPEYRDTYRVEQSGPGGGAIKVEHDVRIADAVGYFDAEVVRLSTDG